MGSLMAGWDSTVLDTTRASFERNRSLTKEEIDAFWKLQKEGGGEEGNDNSGPDAFGHSKSTKECQEEGLRLKSDDMGHQSSTSPGTNLAHHVEEVKPNKIGDWWTRSNWAFLNEPPTEIDESAHKYTAQYHVAELDTKKH